MKVIRIAHLILAAAVLAGSTAMLSACAWETPIAFAGIFKGSDIYSDGKGYSVTALKGTDITAEAAPENPLASVGDHETLLKLLLERGALYDEAEQKRRSVLNGFDDLFAFSVEEEAMPQAVPAPAGGGEAAAPAADMADVSGSPESPAFSQTNEQVEGVSEGDIVKTDGKYIYSMMPGRNELCIVKADKAQLEAVSSINLGTMSGAEFYLAGGDRLVVIGSEYETVEIKPHGTGDAGSADEAANKAQADIAYDGFYGRYARNLTVAVIFDITDRSAPAELRRVSMEGFNVTSRVMGNTLYMVTNKHIWGVPYERADSEFILPYVCDTAAGDTFEPVAYERIYIVPDTQEASYLLVGALDINGGDAFEPEAYFGAASNLYMSTGAMYITNPRWHRQTPVASGRAADLSISPGSSGTMKTDVLRFAVTGTGISYKGMGTVDGHPINQYSMDEYGGYFRIATTDWGVGTYVTVLDKETMKETGRTQPLAPNEMMRSMRFMGDMGYVVTFENTDPLFTIDLSDPHSPKVLGELKIPGFSQYLHPAGDGLLLGIGRDTQELFTRDANGNETVVGFRDVGMKASLFDVSDPFDPKEISVLPLGECWAEVSHNPRALTADTARGIYGFIMESWRQKNSINAVMLRVENRELSVDAMLGISGYYYGTGRICYIGDTLYIVSAAGIDAYDYNTYEKLGGLEF